MQQAGAFRLGVELALEVPSATNSSEFVADEVEVHKLGNIELINPVGFIA